MKRVSNDEFIQKLKNVGSSLTPLEEYKGRHTKIKFKCKNGHIFEYAPHGILKMNTGCPICSNHRVLIGYNDMWTTNPNMATLLLNHNDGYQYTENSTHKLDWKCPICNSIIKSKSPNTVFQQGLSCHVCNDGISFAEKYVASLLQQLQYDYKHDCSFDWSNGKRFDFYISHLSLIIETHGLQHYEERYRDVNRTFADEQSNDAYKEQIALKNGIKHYIQLDCRKSIGEYIKASICNSKLSELFDLSKIDWNKCEIDSYKSIMWNIIDDWNSGIHDIPLIANTYGIYDGTVREYLKKATTIGLCDYNKQSSMDVGIEKSKRSRSKSVRCVETGKVYQSIKDAESDGFVSKHISSVCNGKRKTTGGCHWEYV